MPYSAEPECLLTLNHWSGGHAITWTTRPRRSKSHTPPPRGPGLNSLLAPPRPLRLLLPSPFPSSEHSSLLLRLAILRSLLSLLLSPRCHKIVTVTTDSPPLTALEPTHMSVVPHDLHGVTARKKKLQQLEPHSMPDPWGRAKSHPGPLRLRSTSILPASSSRWRPRKHIWRAWSGILRPKTHVWQT